MKNFTISIFGENMFGESEFIGETDVRAPDYRRAKLMAKMMFRGLDSEQIIIDEVFDDE